MLNKIYEMIAPLGLGPGQVNFIIVLLVTLVASIIGKVILARLKTRVEKTAIPWDDAFVYALDAPLMVLLWIIGIRMAFNMTQHYADTLFIKTVNTAGDLGVIVAITWFVVRFVTQAQTRLVTAKVSRGQSVDRTAVDAVGKLLRLIAVVIACLVAMQTLGFSIAGVLTFGGVGGIAIGFAAKDLLSNFFGGLFVYLDRPFSEGDWIRSPDREIEGTVMKIGWRVTKIETFDSRPLYVPNSAFATISIENPSRMANRRIYETIGIRYEDANAMAKIVDQITEYLKNHDAIDQQQTNMVNFDTFSASSLDLFIYCFTKTQAWAEYHQIKQEVLLRVLEIIDQNNAQCAFPTRTVHLQRESE